MRRPPIEFLFGSLFVLFLLFGSCRSKTNRFIGLVTQGHRSFGLGKGARRARRRRNRWRQAMTSLSGDAMPSTEGSAQPSTTLEASSSHPRVPPFGHSRSRVSLVSELLRWSLSGAATVEQPRRSELYQTQPLNLPSRRPAPAVNLYGFGLGSRTWVWCLTRSLPGAQTRTSTSPLFVVGRSHPNLRPKRSLVLERRPFNNRAFDLYGRLCRQGLHSRGPTTDVGTSRLAPLRRGGSLLKARRRLRTNSSFVVSVRAPPIPERPTYAVIGSDGGVGNAPCTYTVLEDLG